MAKRLTPYQKYLQEVDDRRKRVLELVALGMKKTIIAKKLRISNSRVTQIVKADKLKNAS